MDIDLAERGGVRSGAGLKILPREGLWLRHRSEKREKCSIALTKFFRIYSGHIFPRPKLRLPEVTKRQIFPNLAYFDRQSLTYPKPS